MVVRQTAEEIYYRSKAAQCEALRAATADPLVRDVYAAMGREFHDRATASVDPTVDSPNPRPGGGPMSTKWTHTAQTR